MPFDSTAPGENRTNGSSLILANPSEESHFQLCSKEHSLAYELDLPNSTTNVSLHALAVTCFWLKECSASKRQNLLRLKGGTINATPVPVMIPAMEARVARDTTKEEGGGRGRGVQVLSLVIINTVQ